MSRSLYIHIPFCRSRCSYCDFYSERYDEHLAARYVDVIVEQLKTYDDEFETVYIGGGTPSVLSASLWRYLLSALDKAVQKAEEVTVEINPESSDEDKLRLFHDHGVNRLSIGVQSFNDRKLRLLGRIHTSRDALSAVDSALSCGFENISIDLIYGAVAECLKDWEEDVVKAAAMPVKHISCYSLTLEPSVPLYKLRDRIDDNEVARMYMFNMDYLPRRGFFHYEVSNFAQKGWECMHNINYWQAAEYVGLGPSAVSFLGGERIHNVSSVSEYIRRWKDKESLVSFTDRLTPEERARELAAVQIRTVWGIDFIRFRQLTGFDFLSLEDPEELGRLIKEGFVKEKKVEGKPRGIVLTRRGFLFSDEVSSVLV